MRDINLILRDGSTNLTADENLTFSVPRVYHQKPLAVHVLLPQELAEASDSLVVTITGTTADQKISISHVDAIVTGGQSYPLKLVFPLPPINCQAWNVNLNITDNDTDGDFNAGAVQVWVEESAEDAKLPVTP